MRLARMFIIFFFCCSLSACGNKTLDGIFGINDGSATSAPTDDPCSASSMAIVPNKFIVHWEDGHVSVETSESDELFKHRFVRPNLQLIKHVEYDRSVSVRGQFVQVQSTTAETNSWGPTMVNANAAWTAGANGQGIVVGVVDAAVDYSQPQISPQLAPNLAEVNGKPGVDDDGNGFVDDLYGWDFVSSTGNPSALVSGQNAHATHVSGIIAADHTKGPVLGMAPSAKLVPANFMDATGSGSLGSAIQAMQYVVSRGAKVVNASWGGPSCSSTMKSVMAQIASQNVLVIVAAGNDGNDLGRVADYPANFNFPNQLNIASSTNTDLLDTWSNFSFTLVHLAAPGDTIFSTIPGGQGMMSGTSMAAPMVSGAAALLWSLRPAATAAQIRQALLAGVDNTNTATLSRGRLNVANSMKALLQVLP